MKIFNVEFKENGYESKNYSEKGVEKKFTVQARDIDSAKKKAIKELGGDGYERSYSTHKIRITKKSDPIYNWADLDIREITI